ncbi:MAG: rhomboid family intramembrane serine protease [Pseudomonadota bacterium]
MRHTPPSSGQDQGPAPVNPVPPAILALCAIIIGIEIVFWLAGRGILGGQAGIGWRVAAFETYGFPPRLFAFMAETGQWSLGGLQRVITYAFLNYGMAQAIFACVFILAFGKFVGDLIGGARALVIFTVSAIGAAAVYGLASPNESVLVGSFPGAYGLLGGYTFVLFLALDHADENRLQAFRLVGVLAALQLVFGLFLPGRPLWLADLAGAGIGFVTAAALAPGGLLRWIRRR